MLKVCKLNEVFGDDEVGAPCRSRDSRVGVGVVVRRRGVTRPGQTPWHRRSQYWRRGHKLGSRGAAVSQRPNGDDGGGSGCGSGGGVAADVGGGEHCVRRPAERRDGENGQRHLVRRSIVCHIDATVGSVEPEPTLSVSKVAS